MWQYNYSNELYHYGVPGMRWKNHTYRTDKLDIKRARNSNKDMKYMKKYLKIADKDYKYASKVGDTKAMKKIEAGKFFAKIALDGNLRSQLLGSAAMQTKVKSGSDVVYEISRNNKIGAVDIKINGKKVSYAAGEDTYKNVNKRKN